MLELAATTKMWGKKTLTCPQNCLGYWLFFTLNPSSINPHTNLYLTPSGEMCSQKKTNPSEAFMYLSITLIPELSNSCFSKEEVAYVDRDTIEIYDSLISIDIHKILVSDGIKAHVSIYHEGCKQVRAESPCPWQMCTPAGTEGCDRGCNRGRIQYNPQGEGGLDDPACVDAYSAGKGGKSGSPLCLYQVKQ